MADPFPTCNNKYQYTLFLTFFFCYLIQFEWKLHCIWKIFAIIRLELIKKTYLSASIAEPSSNSSSTVPTAESLFGTLFIEFWNLFPGINEVSRFCFFLGVGGNTGYPYGIISTTKQVVSSFSPLDLRASYRQIKRLKFDTICI